MLKRIDSLQPTALVGSYVTHLAFEVEYPCIRVHIWASFAINRHSYTNTDNEVLRNTKKKFQTI